MSIHTCGVARKGRITYSSSSFRVSSSRGRKLPFFRLCYLQTDAKQPFAHSCCCRTSGRCPLDQGKIGKVGKNVDNSRRLLGWNCHFKENGAQMSSKESGDIRTYISVVDNSHCWGKKSCRNTSQISKSGFSCEWNHKAYFFRRIFLILESRILHKRWIQFLELSLSLPFRWLNFAYDRCTAWYWEQTASTS